MGDAVASGAVAVGGAVAIVVAVRSANAVGVVVVVGGISEVHDNKSIRKPVSAAIAVRDTAITGQTWRRLLAAVQLITQLGPDAGNAFPERAEQQSWRRRRHVSITNTHVLQFPRGQRVGRVIHGDG